MGYVVIGYVHLCLSFSLEVRVFRTVDLSFLLSQKDHRRHCIFGGESVPSVFQWKGGFFPYFEVGSAEKELLIFLVRPGPLSVHEPVPR